MENEELKILKDTINSIIGEEFNNITIFELDKDRKKNKEWIENNEKITKLFEEINNNVSKEIEDKMYDLDELLGNEYCFLMTYFFNKGIEVTLKNLSLLSKSVNKLEFSISI